MAIAGAVVLATDLAKRRMPVFNSGILNVAIWAAAISLISFVSITYNATNDPSFLTYFISMCVWLCSAYMAVSIIRIVHGTLSVKLVANYLIAVCILQCLTAISISQVPAVSDIVNSIFYTYKEGMAEGRLYGIGASLDVAGLRFMAVLVITAYMISCLSEEESSKYLKWYIVAFLITGLISNMISRTSVFGIAIGLAYLLWASLTRKIGVKSNFVRLWKYLSLSIGALAVGTVFLYQTNQGFRDSMHYGFEGFFSLYEKGRWEVNSNRGLIYMWKYIKPESARTWIIGDGYCDDPNNDPYYTGSQPKGGYYKGTDVGYMRFILYFGIIGTIALIGYFCQVAHACCTHFPNYRYMFLLILLCNFIGWIKVSTDIFLVFAIFLAIILAGYSDKQEKSLTTD